MAAVDDARLLHALEAAYEQERSRRDQLEKKYARLKRRYIRLEQAHARMMALQASSQTVVWEPNVLPIFCCQSDAKSLFCLRCCCL